MCVNPWITAIGFAEIYIYITWGIIIYMDSRFTIGLDKKVVYFTLSLFIAGLSLILIVTNFGVSLGGSALIIAYSKGLISFHSAALGLTALFGNSGLAVTILSKITVGNVLGEAAAEGIADETILAWLGPWGLVILASVIITSL